MRKPYLIGITGGSGSGKTTFLADIVQSFSKEELCVISLDDYYHPREKQAKDDLGVSNFDLPTSIDSKAFLADIQKLLNGQIVTRKEYTFNNDKKAPKILTFRPAPILIVEGLFIFYFPEISELIDLKVFVEAKENLKVIRRIKRDRIERNYPLDDVLYRYEHHVLPTFEKYILPFKPTADLIINNNDTFDAAANVFKGFIREKLTKS